jgi:hypothetical protein
VELSKEKKQVETSEITPKKNTRGSTSVGLKPYCAKEILGIVWQNVAPKKPLCKDWGWGGAQ